MKKIETLKTAMIRSVCALCVMSASAAYAAVSIPTVSTAQTGVWIDTFSVATNHAFSTGTPLVMLWSNDECGYCDDFKASLKKSAFTQWQREQSFVFCLVEGESGRDVARNRGAKEFTIDAGGYGEKIKSGYPLVSLLWLVNGEVKSVSTFSGRSGKMGVARQSEMYLEFIDAIETAFRDYGASYLGYFPVSDTENDRFEAEPSTDIVRIPVDRAVAGEVATNILSLYKGATFLKSKEIVWGEDDTRNAVTIKLSDIEGLSYDGTSSLTMTLSSPTDGTSTNGTIHLVSEKENSVTNPYFVGERAVSDLNWADWTFDWDLVMEKVAASTSAEEKSYALAVFSGTLWCPYCKSIEESFFASEKFASWLRDNKVQLALFDQALSASDAYAGKGHLLTYSAGLDHFAGVEHKMTGGAAYLTRHGLAEDDEEVQAVVERTRRLTVDWLPPGSTSARLSNPTILLVDSEGTVLGRLNTWRDRNKVLGDDVRYYDPDENIARLDKLLELAEIGEQDDYSATTRLEHRVGTESSATLQVNSAKRYWNVVDASSGVLTITRTDDSPSPVAFTLYAGGAAIASGSGSLSVKLTSRILSSGGLQIGVSTTAFSSSVNPLVSGMSDGGSFDVSFATSFEPSTVVDNATLPMTFSANVVLEELDVEEKARVSVRRTSGKIPSGLRLKYDKQTRCVVLSGKPSKVVDASTFTYTVTITVGRDKEVMEPVEVTVGVFDPKEINPYLSVSRTTTLPLVSADGILVGTLTVSMTSRNSVKVKYAGASSKSLSFSGSWESLDEEGTVYLSDEKNGVALDLGMTANGVLYAELHGVTGNHSDFVDQGTASFTGSVKLSNDFSPFAGYYTVVLPSEIEGATGSGYMMLKFTSKSSVEKGRVNFSGMLPNGQSMSASGYLSVDPENPGYALLPVFKRTSSYCFSALLRIQADGETLYADDETARIVFADDDVTPYWSCVKNGTGFSGPLELYGGWYPVKTTVSEWLEIFEEQSSPFVLEFVIPEGGVESESYGALNGVPAAVVEAHERKNFVISEKTGYVTISFNKSTGLFSGKGRLEFEGKTVTGTYKGLLTPGWLDCGCGDERVILPFGSGMFYYTDRVNGKSVKKSIKVELH